MSQDVQTAENEEMQTPLFLLLIIVLLVQKNHKKFLTTLQNGGRVQSEEVSTLERVKA